MTYINQNGIPSRCKWQISSNRLINVATGKYLGINGTTLTSYDSAGTAGTVEGDKRIWRINTKNNVTSQELISLEPRSVLTILDNEARLESYTTSAANGTAYYIGANDFTYSGLPAGVMTYSYSTHKFSFIKYPSSQSVYTITMTHKVTGISKTFKIVAKPKMLMLGVPDEGHDHYSYMDSVQSSMGNIFSSYTRLQGTYTKSVILDYIDDYEKNVFVSRSHGNYDNFNTWICLGGTAALNGSDLYYSGMYMEDLSNMRLMVFCACYTASDLIGEGYPTLPQAAVLCGADYAIGFDDELYCGYANDWTEKFFELFGEGDTVSDILDEMDFVEESKGITVEIVNINHKAVLYGDGNTFFNY